MTPEEFARGAIGVPFLEDGRDRFGWDCWGVCWCAYNDVLNHQLPDGYKFTSPRELARQFKDRTKGYWVEVPPVAMALAAIYRKGLVIHAGVVITKRRILHVEQGIETCLEPASSFRIDGYYAPSCLAASLQSRNG